MSFTHYVTNHAGSWVYVGTMEDCDQVADELNTRYQTDAYTVHLYPE